MTDFVVVKNGKEVGRYSNDRATAERHKDEVDGELVQVMAPIRTLYSTYGKP